MRLPRGIIPWLRALRELILPEKCACCMVASRNLVSEDAVCVACAETLTPIAPPFCQICGEPFPSSMPDLFTCPNCHGMQHPFAFAIAGYEFSGATQELVHALKFQGRYETAKALAWLASRALEDERIAAREDWHLVPVPLHSKRHREREYNQSEEIARQLQRFCRFPMLNELRRIRATGNQSRLTRAERLKNLHGAFALSSKARERKLFDGKHLLLIDDVFTTGSTATECAKTLMEQGNAASVAVLTVARG
jgi:ComF family protein